MRSNTFRRNALGLMALGVALCGCWGEGNGPRKTQNNYPDINVVYSNQSTHEAVNMDAGQTVVPEEANRVPMGGTRMEKVQFAMPSDNSTETFHFAVLHGESTSVGDLTMNRSQANLTARIEVTWTGSSVVVERLAE